MREGGGEGGGCGLWKKGDWSQGCGHKMYMGRTNKNEDMRDDFREACHRSHQRGGGGAVQKRLLELGMWAGQELRCRWGVHVGSKKKKDMRMTSVRDVGKPIKVCMLVCK